jgi:hypothetical protein
MPAGASTGTSNLLTLLKVLGLSIVSGLAVYVLNRVGVVSLLYGGGIALLLALPARLATAYAAALLAHASGQCGERSILASEDAGAAPALALGALALGAAAWGGGFLGGHLRTRTRYPLLARLACAAALAGVVALRELAVVPPAELLSNYWTLQRLTPREAAVLLADTRRGWRRLLFPDLQPANAWAAEHQACFATFSAAAAAATAALACVLAAAAWAGPWLCCGASGSSSSSSSSSSGEAGAAGGEAGKSARREAAAGEAKRD